MPTPRRVIRVARPNGCWRWRKRAAASPRNRLGSGTSPRRCTSRSRRRKAPAWHRGRSPAGPSPRGLPTQGADEIAGHLDALIATGVEPLEELETHRDALGQRVDAIRTLTKPGLAIRIHGDLHLGQVLRTDAGWTVL